MLSARFYPTVILDNGLDVGFFSHGKCDPQGAFISSMFFTKLSGMKDFVKANAYIQKAATTTTAPLTTP